jgi:hypothetical protein
MKQFNPLTFLASLGAGGIAVAPFGYFQYVVPHGPGLITYGELMASVSGTATGILNIVMMAVMVIFGLLHLVLTAKLLTQLFAWRKTDAFKHYIADPQRNTTIMASFTSLAMTFNVFIGVVRFFVPALSNNFQMLMLPALIVWAILWVLMMRTEIMILKSSFEVDFDISKISFGWLLQPFALGMVTVAGTGIAAMAKDANIAHTAAFMSIVSGTMGLFLFIVKLISVFKSHYLMKGIPERQFLPSFLIVIPITTIYSISLFRIGHYLTHQFGFQFEAYFLLVILIPFAFQTWYFGFGLTMLKDYFKKDFFRKEYYVTLWALICPFVGYSMQANFIHKFFMPVDLVKGVIFTFLVMAVAFYVFVGLRYLKYEHGKLAGSSANA